MSNQRIIIDTGPLVASFFSTEDHHDWVKEQILSLPVPFMTCEPVLVETFFVLNRIPDGRRRFLQLLQSGILAVEFQLMSHQSHIADLMQKYADVPMSLADACLVRMAELHEGSTIFSLDHHFRLYRKNRRQIIPAILPPEK